MQNKESLSTKEQLTYVGIGIIIALAYTVWLVVIDNWIDENEVKTGFNIIPEAFAQIQPFELQLEQIRDPKDCTRKVVQGRSAEVPFSMKIFYDTTRDSKLEFKQAGSGFPVVQRTNQVMTFYTNDTDQYQIDLELNYEERKVRQVYIEYLSGGSIVLSFQEKFSTQRFCMTIFANTVLPPNIPTKEEIFGESLDYIAQIPAMVIAFNANTITSSTSQSFMWMLMLGVTVMSILSFISSLSGKRKFDSKMTDLDDAIKNANDMVISMDNLQTTITDRINEVISNLRTILSIPQIKQQLPKKEKESKFKKFFSIRKKKGEDVTHDKSVESETEELIEDKQTQEEEVVKELEIEKEKPSGGFIIEESEKKETQPRQEGNPMQLQPKIFLEVLKGIDYKKKIFMEGVFEKFTYGELNESYGWIVKYRKWMEDTEKEIPAEKLEKQKIIETIIYEAIFRKMEKHQVDSQSNEEDEKDD